MSELEPIELGVPFDHTIAFHAVGELGAYIVGHNPVLLEHAIEFQKGYNQAHGIEANKYQAIRLLTHATAKIDRLSLFPLRVPPAFELLPEEVWCYIAPSYEPRRGSVNLLVERDIA